MKWYWWLLIAIVVIVIISFVIYKTKTKTQTPVEGSECILNSSTNRTATVVDLPIVQIPQKGIIVNGVCVKK